MLLPFTWWIKSRESSDKILELASLVSRSKKLVKVYPVPILLEVNSLLASYTIPGMRVEGTTYDVPTFSALKGAMESIYKHPGAIDDTDGRVHSQPH